VDSRSLINFLHYCGIEDFWTFVSISHTIELPSVFLARRTRKFLEKNEKI